MEHNKTGVANEAKKSFAHHRCFCGKTSINIKFENKKFLELCSIPFPKKHIIMSGEGETFCSTLTIMGKSILFLEKII